MNSINCIIQARMGSTRLPGKVMMEIDKDKNPILFYVINQLKNCINIDNIVVATTTFPEDNRIADFLQQTNVACFRGNDNDVLDRYYKCAKHFVFLTIVRITSDCPLIDPQIVDRVIEKFQTEKYDYVSNCIPRTFPYGTEVEIFSFNALEQTWKNAKKPSEREHVTPYIYNNRDKFRICSLCNDEDLSRFRWTVDRIEDLNLVKQLISLIKTRPILMRDILDVFKQKPELFEINKNLTPNEGYIESLKADQIFLEKLNKQNETN